MISQSQGVRCLVCAAELGSQDGSICAPCIARADRLEQAKRRRDRTGATLLRRALDYAAAELERGAAAVRRIGTTPAAELEHPQDENDSLSWVCTDRDHVATYETNVGNRRCMDCGALKPRGRR